MRLKKIEKKKRVRRTEDKSCHTVTTRRQSIVLSEISSAKAGGTAEELSQWSPSVLLGIHRATLAGFVSLLRSSPHPSPLLHTLRYQTSNEQPMAIARSVLRTNPLDSKIYNNTISSSPY